MKVRVVDRITLCDEALGGALRSAEQSFGAVVMFSLCRNVLTGSMLTAVGTFAIEQTPGSNYHIPFSSSLKVEW